MASKFPITPTLWPPDVLPEGGVELKPTIQMLPDEVEELLEVAFPDYLGYESVRHGEGFYTVTLLTLQYSYKTFRMLKGDSGRWTLVPISGFKFGDTLNATLEDWNA